MREKTSMFTHQRRIGVPISARSATRGFTLVEVLIAVSIMIIIAGVSGFYLNSLYGAKRASNAADQIVVLLTLAQEKSASQEDDSRWGVYFDRPANPDLRSTFTLYKVDEAMLLAGTPLPPGEIIRQEPLPDGLAFTIPGSGSSVNVIFSPITGLPTSAATVRLVDDRATDSPKTITVDTNGRIEDSDF